MKVWNCRPGTMSRPLAETIPAVTVSDRPPEEAVKEVVHATTATDAVILIVRILRYPATTVRTLDGRFRIDVDHTRFQLLRDLRKRVRHLMRRGDGQRSRIARLLPLLALDTGRNHRPAQNAERQRGQNTACVDPTTGPEAHPNCARIHK